MRFHSLADDAVSSFRRIQRHPRNFLVLILMLAVSVGCITGMFGVAYQAIHGKLPYPQADRIAITTDDILSALLFSPYNFQPNPNLDTVFQEAATYDYLSTNLDSHSGLPPARIQVAMVTPQFFSTLGVKLSLGRDFSDSMQPPPNAPVWMPNWLPIIISHELWLNSYGGNEGIVGHSITLDMSPYHFQVIGVAPPGVNFPPGVDAWIPAHTVSYYTTQEAGAPPDVGGTIGLLRPGLSMAEAEARIRTWPASKRLSYYGDAVRLTSLREFLGGKLYRLGPILWLVTIFFLLLTIAAAMSIFQIELETRAQEFNIRKILGATPDRLFRSISFETGLVLMVALTASFLVRFGLLRVTAAYLRLPGGSPPSVSWMDLAMAAGVVAIVFVAAAISQGRGLRLISISEIFRGRAIQSDITPHAVSRFRFPVQVIPATLILITAAMLARSAYNLMKIDLGVQPHNAFVCEIALPFDIGDEEQATSKGVDPKLPEEEKEKKEEINLKKFEERLNSYFSAILQRLKKEPGVTSVGAISVSPYSGYAGSTMDAFYSRTPGRPPDANVIVDTLGRSITSGALSTLGMRLIYGREFNDENGGNGDQGTAIVNQALADHLGGGPNALGQYIRLATRYRPPYRVIGVVNNVREENLYSPAEPAIYFPFSDYPVPDTDIVVRTAGTVPASELLRSIQAAVKSVAPDASVSHFAPLTEMVESAGQWTDYSAYFLLTLALLGIFLAGICAWSKAVSEMRRREHEIGVRLALGAAPGRVMRLIVGAHLKLTLLAALLGAAFTWWFARLMSYLFYEVKPSDIGSYLIGIGAITGYVVLVVIWSVYKAVHRNPQELMKTRSVG